MDKCSNCGNEYKTSQKTGVFYCDCWMPQVRQDLVEEENKMEVLMMNMKMN